MKKVAILFVFMLMSLCLCAQTLYINEIMSSNSTVVTPSGLTGLDWVEIYNPTAEEINLQGYYLTDDPLVPMKWTFPSVPIAANGYLLVWCSDLNTLLPNNEVHANFKISAGGETIVLTNPLSVQVDLVNPIALGLNVSWGRKPDGTSNWYYFNQPTPGTANTTDGYQEFLTEPVFSASSGNYTSSFDLTITHPDTAVVIRYTLDGSEPTDTSTVLSGSLFIDSKAGTPNDLSTIRTTMPETSGTYHGYHDFWQAPLSEIFKGTVVRAKAFKTGAFARTTVTHTYFVDSNINTRYTLPVFSISTNRDNFFDPEIGIYVTGNGFDGDDYHTANFAQEGRPWERPVNMDLMINGISELNQDVGTRIQGNRTTRADKKSLKFYARTDYGPGTFNYSFFPNYDVNSFQRIILRNGGQDVHHSLFRDGLTSELVKHLGIPCQAFRPSIMFLNGEYWGLHNIRESVDEYTLNKHYGIDTSNVVIIKHDGVAFVDYGFSSDISYYNDMMDFAANNSLSDQANYEIMKTKMDITNYINYMLTELWVENTDWGGTNIRVFRAKTPVPGANPYLDGRWRWYLYDTDAGFGLETETPYYDMLSQATATNGPAWPNPPWATLLFRKLLENSEFKQEFIIRFMDNLNTTFKSERVVAKINEIQELLAPNMEEHINRWPYHGSYDTWVADVDFLKYFATNRTSYQISNLRTFFTLNTASNVTLDVSNKDHGSIKINYQLIDSSTPGVTSSVYPWTGKYFKNMPVSLKAVPKPGYRFIGWQGYASTADSIQFTLTGSLTITALFDIASEFAGDAMNPPAYNLFNGPFTLFNWPATSPAGTYPAYMRFQQSRVVDPNLAQDMIDPYTLAYNLTSRSRMEGLNGAGFSFINTGATDFWQPGASGRDLGAAVLGLKTIGQTGIKVSFKAGTVLPNFRVYAIRLQYRIGTTGAFTDVTDNGLPVEYVTNPTAGHTQTFGPITLPSAVENQSYVQLRWKYYWVSVTSGARAKLSLDDIIVRTDSPTTPAGLVVNEFISNDSLYTHTGWVDENNTKQDWVELYNNSTSAVNLLGYYLSDNAGNPKNWAFPAVTIPANGFLKVWASDKNLQDAAGQLHANFKISQSGEPILLTNWSGTLVDQTPSTPIPSDYALSRIPNGTGSWTITQTPSPSAVNHLPDSPANVTFIRVGEELKLQWDAMTGAIGYRVYSADIPNASVWNLETADPIVNTYLMINPLTAKKFYKVAAVYLTAQ